MKEKIFKFSPVFIQELLISLFNIIAYKERYAGKYKELLNQYKQNEDLRLDELKNIQKKRFNSFLKEAIQDSKYYKDYPLVDIEQIYQLPIISKEDLRTNINDFFTVAKKDGVVSKTGGTTGKSLEILFTKEGNNEKFAYLDYFRGKFGYELGKKTAWFSGKDLLTNKDVQNHIFWKTDHKHNVRYYSTFHIKEEYLQYYVNDLLDYKPEFLSGFPSTMLEIAKHGVSKGYQMPKGVVKAIFPTAESINPEMREIIEHFFNAKMFNQYSSSEGAPFIIECKNGNLHMDLQTGVFEVLDDFNKPTDSGRLVITSFFTQGTPLIRYDIGDRLSLEKSKTCNCGNHNPLVKEILGRIDDYIYSPENGKINLGNISNTLKDTKGIIKFQVIQDKLNEIIIKLVIDSSMYDKKVENKFIQNWVDRVGDNMKIDLEFVNDIPVEKSGKYRMVKNNIKHLI
ncbi:phenylacetate--CoA ligase family protein [Empedobacter sp. GD03739]|uniref:phenylacetate--CoA ligase family protein n=1 Tax=Empedobacter sp. GD03739 TaxID=2975376 RepID=UPI0024490D0D|nr:phenylacetate--CoA ligase family protein [Empedobacter sp. GD03739]MDH1601216.1 phenylacetate--CoA ligase family protein [Empedobacter sp. GD03739]